MTRNLRNCIAFFLFSFGELSITSMGITGALDLISNVSNPGKLVHLSSNSSYGLTNQTTWQHSNGTINTNNSSDVEVCFQSSTSSLLIAQAVPGMLLKLAYPLILMNFKVKHKLLTAYVLFAIGIVLLGLAKTVVTLYLAMVIISFGLGTTMVTELSMMSTYGDGVLTAFSLGYSLASLTAGIIYTILKTFLSTSTVMFLSLVYPISMLSAYLSLKPIENPNLQDDSTNCEQPLVPQSTSNEPTNPQINRKMFFKSLRYSLPLIASYFFQTVGMSLFELLDIKSSGLSLKKQYRIYQMVESIAPVFMSLTLPFFTIGRIWILAVIQLMNLVLFLLQILKFFNVGFIAALIWIAFHGSIGMLSYINTYNNLGKLSKEESASLIVFVGSADSVGVMLGYFIAALVRNSICPIALG